MAQMSPLDYVRKLILVHTENVETFEVSEYFNQ